MIKKKLIFVGFIVILSSVAISAQQLTESNSDAQPNRQNRLIQELGLSQAQVGEIREIRRRTALSLGQARQNFQQAKKELDEAIYADSVSEEDLRLKLRRVSETQAEITKAQALREYAVRKVLRPEQLNRFRELRRNFSKQITDDRRLNQRQRIQNRRSQRNSQQKQPIRNTRKKPTDRRQP